MERIYKYGGPWQALNSKSSEAKTTRDPAEITTFVRAFGRGRDSVADAAEQRRIVVLISGSGL